MNTHHRPLRLNIGFLIGQPIGTSHDFNFDYDEIYLGEDLSIRNFSGLANFSRTPQGLFLQAEFIGDLDLECVNCLEITKHELKMEFSELYAFDSKSVSDSGLLVPENGYIELAPILREYTILEIPINPKCKPECKGLCLECGQNLNDMDCGHSRENKDSPFASLKTLFEDPTS